METEEIGMREFRENLAGYLEGGRPLAITRHGETLGFFIPAQKRGRKAAVEAMRAAAREFDAMIAAWGASEDELMDDYKGIRRASRERGNPELNPAHTRRQHPDSRCTRPPGPQHPRNSCGGSRVLYSGNRLCRG
jgi:antitoxin (DNA-binding transcriptional repressor) of toxin-antitoxin stability system